MAKKTGRPLKLNEEITITSRDKDGHTTERTVTRGERVVEMVRASNYRDDAARVAGIHPATLFDYLAKGRNDRSAGKTTQFTEFADAIEKAQAESDSAMVVLIRAAATSPNHWQAASWLLERRHPDKWGQRTRVMIETTVKREIAEEMVTFLAGVLERRVPDSNARTAIINDLLDWSTQRSSSEVGESEQTA